MPYNENVQSADCYEFTVKDIEKERVDTVVSRYLSHISRSELHNRLQSIEINGKVSKNAQKVKIGDHIRVQLRSSKETQLVPMKVEWEVLFENEDVLVIDKPPHIPVHAAPGVTGITIAAGVLYHLGNAASLLPDTDLRPGIVHRLDADTSGVMIIAKNRLSLRFLSRQFAGRVVKKVYAAIVKGIPVPPEASVDFPLARHPIHRMKFHCPRSGGKTAHTHYTLIEANAQYALLRCEPLTGRTHQIRVHLQHLGHPILGDPLYARKDAHYPEATLMLHACCLRIFVPGEDCARDFVSPLPSRFALPLSCTEEELCQKNPLFSLTPA